MKEPPDLVAPLPDLRTVGAKPTRPLSLEFLDILNGCRLRQAWYLEEKISLEQSPLPFVGRFSLTSGPNEVAAHIRSVIGVDNEFRKQCNTWSEFLTGLIERTERVGVLVMRNSVVGHSTNRKLSVDEFRGFALSDPLAPLVFINSGDARCAQIFTIAHELAHIWIGQSGISNPDPKRRTKDFTNVIERFCNSVAAELLVPEENIRGTWRPEYPHEKNISRLATFHKVSKTAAAIRAREKGWITPEFANLTIDAEKRKYADQKERSKGTGGPTFWSIFAPRNSALFTDTLVRAVRQDRIPFRDAATLLETKVRVLRNYLAKTEAG